MWFKSNKKYHVSYRYLLERYVRGNKQSKVKIQHFDTDHTGAKRDAQARQRLRYMRFTGGWEIINMNCFEEKVN